MSSFRPNPEDIGPDGRLKDTKSAQEFKEKVQKFNKDKYGGKTSKREDFGTIDKPDLMKEHRIMYGKALMVGVVVFALGYLWASARVSWFK